jgi:hypothetical protein
MTSFKMPVPDEIYVRNGDITVFKQLAAKVIMDHVTNEDYFGWLDWMASAIGQFVRGAKIAEKSTARTTPPLNTAVYYDTAVYSLLPTGALLRTSCNVVTHAFCAFKMAEDQGHVREDHRYVFDGDEKATIQRAPASPEAVTIVKRLLARTDIEHPGTFLHRLYAIQGVDLSPAILLDDHRFTFFVWLDGRDALRCSIDRATVRDLRGQATAAKTASFGEVEIAIYPRVSPEIAGDPRVVEVMALLTNKLCEQFGTATTSAIKYQRAAEALAIHALLNGAASSMHNRNATT